MFEFGSATYLRRRFYLILMALSLLAACRDADNDLGTISKRGSLEDRLTYAIAKEDIGEAISIINGEKLSKSSKNAIQVLDGLWTNENPRFKSTNNQIRLKLEIADYMLQQQRDIGKNARLDDYILFVRKSVQGADVENIAKAIRILAYLGLKEDVGMFSSYLNSREKIIADSAAIGIGMSCYVSVEDIPQFRSIIQNESQRKYFDDTWKDLTRWRSSCEKLSGK